MSMRIFLAFLITINTCFAEGVKVVKKGEVVPFDGVLFTKELEKSIRMDMQISDKKINTLSKLNELNEKEIEILTKRLEIHQEKTRSIIDREVQMENSSFWKYTIYFVSGALITGLISYGINR